MSPAAGLDWHAIPWTPGDVFRTILETIGNRRPLDPEGVQTILREKAVTYSEPVRVPAAFSTSTHACSEDRDSSALGRFLEPLCSGSELLNVHHYAASPAPNPLADTRLAGLADDEVRAQWAYLGAFLRSAPERSLTIVDLHSDEQFMTEMAGHFPFPLNVSLVVPQDGAQMVMVYSFTAQPGDSIGDRIDSISVYSRR